MLSLPAGLWLHQDTVGPGYHGLCPPFGKGHPVPPWGLQVWEHPLSLSCRLSLRDSLSPCLSTELAAAEATWLLLAPQHLQQKAAALVFIWDHVRSPWARNPPMRGCWSPPQPQPYKCEQMWLWKSSTLRRSFFFCTGLVKICTSVDV